MGRETSGQMQKTARLEIQTEKEHPSLWSIRKKINIAEISREINVSCRTVSLIRNADYEKGFGNIGEIAGLNQI